MDLSSVPANTCPVCGQRALEWGGNACSCSACGSAFEFDQVTRRCRYTYIGPQYPALANSLIGVWLTRREAFDRVGSVDTQSDETPAALFGKPRDPRRTSLTVVWGILVGALALIPILCACLAALMLAPGMAQTRRMIANANQPAGELTGTASTVAGAVILTGTDVSAYPAFTAAPAISATQADEVKPAIRITGTGVAKPLSPMNSPLQPTATHVVPVTVQVETPVATSVPRSTSAPNAQATATLPPTFTAAPTNGALVSPIATPTSSPVTPTATHQAEVTSSPTVTPSATPTPSAGTSVLISSSIVISTVMFNGTPTLGEADQYVEIQNRGSNPVSIGNWTIRALSSGRKFYFTQGLVLMPGETCRVYGSSPPATSSGCGSFSFSSATPVWSTVKDTAELYSDQGVLVGVYRYGY